MSKEETPTGNALRTFAESVDASTSWQFHGARGNFDDDEFIAWAVSKGPIPIVTVEDFGDIASMVTIEAPEVDEELGPLRIHFVRFEGDLAGLELFTELITGVLDRGAEGEELDVHRALGGPLLTFASVVAGNQWSQDLLSDPNLDWDNATYI